MKNSKNTLWLLMLVVSVASFAGCSSDENNNPLAPSSGNKDNTEAAGNTIVDIASGSEDFESLVFALGKAELVGALQEEGPYTVFAPNDDAFAKLPADFVEQLFEPRNKEKLRELLLYHVVGKEIFAEDLRRFQFTPTLADKYLWIRKYWGTVRVNNAKVVTANIDASNGVIHEIDTVLVPRGFELVPAEETPVFNIVETADRAGAFKTLLFAAGAAELADTLAEGGPFTVFAPTDDAFNALPAGLVDALLLEENKAKLQQLLLYHVVNGTVLSGDLSYYQRVNTLADSPIRIIKWFGNVWVNSSRVTTPDVLATNGVIHVINRVLIPSGFTLENDGVTYDAESLELMLKSLSDEEEPPTDLDVRYLESVN